MRARGKTRKNNAFVNATQWGKTKTKTKSNTNNKNRSKKLFSGGGNGPSRIGTRIAAASALTAASMAASEMSLKNIFGSLESNKSFEYTSSGEINEIPNTHHGKPIFRKYTDDPAQIRISKMLIKAQNENKNKYKSRSPTLTISKHIIKNYKVIDTKTNKYVDMEMLDTDLGQLSADELREIMTPVKNYLQSLGIVYIDWKPDNIGVDEDGNVKLFDFDCSGVVDLETKKWIIEPQYCYNYRIAKQSGITDPFVIDNMSFNRYLTQNL